jgi:hypothetical protein
VRSLTVPAIGFVYLHADESGHRDISRDSRWLKRYSCIGKVRWPTISKKACS